MEKSKWPKRWKDQYNEVIRQRLVDQRIKQGRDDVAHAREFPEIWNFDVSEETVLPTIAYCFPLHRVLTNLLQKFISPKYSSSLNLSSQYLLNTEKICPAYYSDRERTVVILNRFKKIDQWDELFSWMSYMSANNNHPHMHLMLGIIFLDQYLSKTHQDIWLIEAIHHLGRAEPWLEREDSQQALAALQALAFYLNRDFEKALGFLGARKKKTFEENFTELIQKVA